MRTLVFAVYDAAAEAFLTPLFFDTKGQAIRAFSDACNAEDHAFGKHAEDYTFFHIGFYDPLKGRLEALDTPDSMGIALQYVERSLAERTGEPAHIFGEAS